MDKKKTRTPCGPRIFLLALLAALSFGLVGCAGIPAQGSSWLDQADVALMLVNGAAEIAHAEGVLKDADYGTVQAAIVVIDDAINIAGIQGTPEAIAAVDKAVADLIRLARGLHLVGG
ncbi:MAG: hypothetical protein HGA78_01185 [Nitrospirales bacterium]|nr:hypothetical protein [Nitrospirales bacterium]